MDNGVFIVSLISLAVAIVGLSWFAGSDAPYVATKDDVIDPPLKAAGVKAGKIFYELGSGDGRVVLAAARLGAKAYGVEQSWIRVWMSRWKARQLKLKDAYFFHGNIFRRQYYPANIVFIYLLQPAIDRLEEKLTQELNKGSILITQTYHFKHLKPYKKIGNFNLYKV